MRILGVSQKWGKLGQDTFSTFRFARRDKDWAIGEVIQIVYKPRSKEREVLGTAKIIGKEQRAMAWSGDKTGIIKITNDEAITDGFKDTLDKDAYFYMWEFMWDNYGGERLLSEPMNKLTLKWVVKE